MSLLLLLRPTSSPVVPPSAGGATLRLTADAPTAVLTFGATTTTTFTADAATAVLTFTED